MSEKSVPVRRELLVGQISGVNFPDRMLRLQTPVVADDEVYGGTDVPFLLVFSGDDHGYSV